MIGNIFNPPDITGTGNNARISNTRLTRHFNVLTHENHMKPSYLSSDYNAQNNTHQRNASGFTTADNMVNAAIAANIKVVGHTLLWHSQIPNWQRDMGTPNNTVALAAMKAYITDVVDHFKGRIHTWDVLNEVFPDGVSASANWRNVMRTTGDSQAPNPWYVAIGADFVYEGFLAARLADPDAILYYNDYNTDQVGKATMIRNMVRDVNERYKTEHATATHSNNGTRNLIEGIGMQEHHNLGVQASAVRATLNLFRPLNVKISVSELDVLSQSWGEFSSNPGSNTAISNSTNTVTNTQVVTQATRYREYMLVYLEVKDIIERISIWGVTDNQSWRAKGLPLLFDSQGKAKPAYYGFVGALP
jgi:endo-1,4-beta-xylanase